VARSHIVCFSQDVATEAVNVVRIPFSLSQKEISMRNNLVKFGLVAAVGLSVVFNGGITQATYSESGTVAYLSNGVIKIGLDMAKGGSITYLSRKSGSTWKSNMVNCWDLGREIQPSFYGGPFPFSPPGLAKLGEQPDCPWNPTQAGNYKTNASDPGDPSPIDYTSHNDTMIYVRTFPQQWALDNYLGSYAPDCTIESWVSLDANNPLLIDVHTRLNTFRNDQTGYNWSAVTVGGGPDNTPNDARWGQGNVCAYVNKGYDTLRTYLGNDPFTNPNPYATNDLFQLSYTNGITNTDYRATENWSAFMNNSNYGLGLITPGNLYHGSSGDNSNSSFGFRDLLAKSYENIDNFGTYDFYYGLVPGSLGEIRSTAYAIHADEVAAGTYLPNYVFNTNNGRCHWTTDVSTGINGNWAPESGYDFLTLQSNVDGDTQMLGPEVCFSGQDVSMLYIRARCNIFGGGADHGQIYWDTDTDPRSSHSTWVSEEGSRTFELINDGQWHTYQIDMTVDAYGNANPYWTDCDMISRLRFDPTSYWHYVMDIQFITSSRSVALSYMGLNEQFQVVPEPSIVVLLLSGGIGLTYLWRRKHSLR
jgi:hypothetical protein